MAEGILLPCVRAGEVQLSPTERQAIEATVERLIALLDVSDGDPDVELNGDELDGRTTGEDEFQHHYVSGPGCPVSNPGGCEHDGREIGDGY
jgi:hypothetical protein